MHIICSIFYIQGL